MKLGQQEWSGWSGAKSGTASTPLGNPGLRSAPSGLRRLLIGEDCNGNSGDRAALYPSYGLSNEWGSLPSNCATSRGDFKMTPRTPAGKSAINCACWARSRVG